MQGCQVLFCPAKPLLPSFVAISRLKYSFCFSTTSLLPFSCFALSCLVLFYRSCSLTEPQSLFVQRYHRYTKSSACASNYQSLILVSARTSYTSSLKSSSSPYLLIYQLKLAMRMFSISFSSIKYYIIYWEAMWYIVIMKIIRGSCANALIST